MKRERSKMKLRFPVLSLVIREDCCKVICTELQQQAVFIVVFMIALPQGYKLENSVKGYPALQDVNVMIFLGLGFLFGFLKMFGFSGIAFNFLNGAIGLQWAIILDTLIFRNSTNTQTIGINSLRTGLMSIFPVLISCGVVLGKVNPLQLVVMTMLELSIFTANRYIMTHYLMMTSHNSMMHGHIFGAYFGLAASWIMIPPLIGNKASEENEKSKPISDLFSILGTLFLWMFWPSFNSIMLTNSSQLRNAVYNTFFTLAVSTVTVFSVSSLLNQKGKFKMIIVRNGILAGGVSAGFIAYMVQHPYISMTLGLIAGIMSTISFTYLQKPMNLITLVHDTCGIHYTFGIPGLLGGIAYTVIILMADFGIGISSFQALVGVGCILLTLVLSLGGGILTGLLLKCKLLRPPKKWHFFHDQPYWEFPHVDSHI
ncbi:blood group Rh(CE) polypeptide isoform X2 [Dendropsophus ebraccatus]|uniref:blood group Rh(CE) polypeptide isoform X2 n=1 Tax=Dendropsophus ebraccatus TaxID=150705 RepID=UPI003831079E